MENTMKAQARNIHIGNQGEHIVATLLSKDCIVRDVGQGKDTGIDLYCEIVSEKTLELSLHFFCQIKTQKTSFNLNTIGDKYFDYWGNQPVPVFLFLVKYEDERTIQENHQIWVYDIPYILSKRDAKALRKTEPSRDVDENFELCKVNNNKDKMTLECFINGHISWSHGLWQLRRFGLVLPNPEVKVQPHGVLVGGFSYLYRDKINNVIENIKYLRKHDTQE